MCMRKGDSHVDTPKSCDLIASIVICLPCEFEGGVLIVRSNRDESELDWRKEFGASVQFARTESIGVRSILIVSMRLLLF
jgi:hypothetical protein